jgi:hypothetical protein
MIIIHEASVAERRNAGQLPPVKMEEGGAIRGCKFTLYHPHPSCGMVSNLGTDYDEISSVETLAVVIFGSEVLGLGLASIRYISWTSARS